MKEAKEWFKSILDTVPPEIKAETKLEFDVSDRIYYLMQEKGLSKKQLADALGKRPCEVTKWLSGQHNFTLSTIGMLSSFFGKPIITVV